MHRAYVIAAFAILAFVVAFGLPIAAIYLSTGDLESMAIISTFFGVPTLLLGVPLYFVFAWQGWRRWWQALGAGCVVGVLEVAFVHLAMFKLAAASWLVVPFYGCLALLIWFIASVIPSWLLGGRV